MVISPDNFIYDTFQSARLIDCRDGDIIRIDSAMRQVLHTLGFVLVARDLATGEQRHFAVATSEGLEKRVGEPLEVDW
jgi:hypothetical protein